MKSELHKNQCVKSLYQHIWNKKVYAGRCRFLERLKLTNWHDPRWRLWWGTVKCQRWKWHAEKRNALLSREKWVGGGRGLFIIKGFWVWTNTDGFFWRTDLFLAGLVWCNCSLGTSKKNKGSMTWVRSQWAVGSGSARIEWRSLRSPITEPMTFRGRNSTFAACTISPSNKWLWELFLFKQSQAPNRILKQNHQGRNLQVLHNTVFCTTTYKTFRHWAKCLSFYWKHIVNTDNGQLNKKKKSLLFMTYNFIMCTYIQSTIALYNCDKFSFNFDFPLSHSIFVDHLLSAPLDCICFRNANSFFFF